MIRAHSSSGKRAIPVPTAGKATARKPRKSAISRLRRVERRRPSAPVRPPNRMLAAWMTKRAFNVPPPVMAASPTSTGPSLRHSAWICGPPARAIAPATPPPNSRSLLAALTMASTSCCVRSPCKISTVRPPACQLISSRRRRREPGHRRHPGLDVLTRDRLQPTHAEVLDGEGRHHHRIPQGQAHRVIGLHLLLGEASEEPGGHRVAGAGWVNWWVDRQGGKVNVLAVTVECGAFRPLFDDQPAQREAMAQLL